MFKKHKVDLSARVLPLRNANISFNTPSTLALPTHVWFTPEQIIFDAFSMVADVVWLWKTFKKLLPAFVLKLAALVFLAFVLISPKIGTTVVAESVKTRSAADSLATSLVPEKEIEIHAEIVAKEKTKATPKSVPSVTYPNAAQKFSADGKSRWPVPFSYISTYFSGYHQGIDIPSSYGSPVHPFQSGTVVFAGWDGGFGKQIIIKHTSGLITKYAHLSSISVQKGTAVGVNSTVGKVGTTGYATGPHLHFEAHTTKGSINPLSILP